jgi:hypothetical protein
VTVSAFDGRTGAPRWARAVPCAAACDSFLALGADVSGDGKWVVFDEGDAAAAHRVHVLAAADGAPRGAPVESAVAVPESAVTVKSAVLMKALIVPVEAPPAPYV